MIFAIVSLGYFPLTSAAVQVNRLNDPFLIPDSSSDSYFHVKFLVSSPVSHQIIQTLLTIAC